MSDLWILLGAHVLVSGAVIAVGTRLGRGVFAVAALIPAATSLWALGRLNDRSAVTADVTWVEGLDLELAFSVGPLAALMTLVVSGIGVFVFVYAAGYFSPGTPGLARFTATLSAFGTAMVGLVWADSVWTLFVFWELTSVTSFLLVGHNGTDASARRAARRALLVTAAGGLVLLAGFVVLADRAGTARLSEMGPVSGGSAAVAAVLVLTAAATKSAQVPFHVWLPGAMVAPTPVSAYLHSATMVKAGVLLMALATPVVGGVAIWRPVGLVLGIASMLWGALGALRHHDAKLILAWGTVSQLGLMVTLLALGTPKAVFAAISILVAHAVFKAALFMVVGEIDVRTGSRDIRVVSGLWRSMPVALVVAVVSGASMAGVPPLLGFPAKEAAIEAVLGGSGAGDWIVAAAVIGGAVLTVAYTSRLLLGLFATDPAVEPACVQPRRWTQTAPAAVLAAASIAGFAFTGSVSDVVRSAAEEIDPGATAYTLLRWPGLTTALVVSAIVIVVGAGLGAALLRRRRPDPAAVGAALVDELTDAVIVLARKVTGRVQHGSLPIYLATMAATLAVASIPFTLAFDASGARLWDNGAQALLALLVVLAGCATAAVGSRLGAALALGVVGLGVAGIFVSQGAPDLALTQLLVETVVVVGFVVALGRQTQRFPPGGRVWRGVRIGVSGLAGVSMALALLAAGSNQVGEAPTEALIDAAADEGGGNNTVNVILTDIRALDTLGEVVVLAVVAIGILALVGPAATRSTARRRGAAVPR